MATSVRDAIWETLTADATLVGYLGDDNGVYHRTAPQEATFPFVLFHKQAGHPEWTFGDHHNDELWTIKAVDNHASADVAEAIYAHIEDALHDAPLEVDGYGLIYCRREIDVDYGEHEEGIVIHHIGAQYRIMLVDL